MKRSIQSTCIILLGVLLLPACEEEPAAKAIMSKKGSNTMSTRQPKNETVPNGEWKVATISYMDFEGGFFGIVTDKGEKLLPMNLSKDFQQVGAKVRIKGKLIDDMMTTQQWGQPFRISEIELIKAGKSLNDSKSILY